MPHTTVREIQGDEMLDIMHRLPSYALMPSPPLSDRERRQETLRQRAGASYYALFEEGTAVSCAAYTRMEQHVRGAIYSAGGIWDVATLPGARRKGYSRRVLTGLMAGMRGEGRAFACLYPFRESFYERLGYVSFPLPRKARFEPSAVVPLLQADLGGEVDLTAIGDGYDVYRAYELKRQRAVHGMAVWETGDEASARSNRWWLALAKVDGEVAGVMVYDLKGERVAEYRLRAFRFLYDTSLARSLLLAWIARHVDQASEVELWLPPSELPEMWMADLKVHVETTVRAPMARVLDVAAIGGMSTGPGGFSARIADPICPWNEGTWRLETIDGLLQTAPAQDADCELGIQSLAALVYGTHDPGDFSLRGWGDPSPEVQAAMQEMFPPRLPYLHEYF